LAKTHGGVGITFDVGGFMNKGGQTFGLWGFFAKIIRCQPNGGPQIVSAGSKRIAATRVSMYWR
jgi:hypothetical protein